MTFHKEPVYKNREEAMAAIEKLDRGWYDARIVPYQNLSLDPACMVFHYGQEMFEGLKAYRTENGDIQLFRPRENAKRMNNSAERICLPEIPEEDFVEAVSKERGELFALKVKGESMIEAGILPNDIVIFEQTKVLENGEIGAILLGEEATVKRFFREKGGFRLQPENREMEPIYCNECEVLGRLCALIRSYE